MFIVIELQKSGTQVSTLSYSFEAKREAEAKYHAILSTAAQTGLDSHGAIILMDDCSPLQFMSYGKEEA